MDRYNVTIKGETPMLMHQDNLEWDGFMKRWGLDPANKKLSVAGDDRSPGFRWIGYLYHYKDTVMISSDSLMTTLREGGVKCPTGKGKKTYKSQTQSGLLVDQENWPLYNPVTGDVYKVDGLEEMKKETDYIKHEDWAIEHKFELFAKRARVGMSKHVRVRPRFDLWAASGTITVLDESITQEVLGNILTFAGAYSGLGNWRPSAPHSPGPFGRFTAELSKL